MQTPQGPNEPSLLQDAQLQAFVGQDALPIRHEGPVYKGKVRAVYWLSAEDSANLRETRGYDIPAGAPLGLMVISDRISAFDCIWRGAGGLTGVPGKGAALNAISLHWFQEIEAELGIPNHVVEAPHPMLWVVRRARPLRLEAIVRQYITGSMWRAYERGTRRFCGIELPEGYERNQRLDALLMTPSTKGTLLGLEGILEAEDTPISVADILRHREAFGLREDAEVERVTQLAFGSFRCISRGYAAIQQILVDTKFELGWIEGKSGEAELALIDEVGTPDSSRLWASGAYADGRIVESCKEGFRQHLLETLPQDILTDAQQMSARMALAAETVVSQDVFLSTSTTYRGVAKAVTGCDVPIEDNPKAAMMSWLSDVGLLRIT